MSEKSRYPIKEFYINQKYIDSFKPLLQEIFLPPEQFFSDIKFYKKTVKKLENQKFDTVNAIVLHRTVSPNLKSTLNAFKNGLGTHFIVAKNGAIYQTADLSRTTSHVGYIKSKCFEKGICLKEYNKSIEVIRQKKGKNKEKAKKEHKLETKTFKYPERYPFNIDSIGIEIVGTYDDKNTLWEDLTNAQISSVCILIAILLNLFKLTEDDIYCHEIISRKTEGEGRVTLNRIKKYLPNLVNTFFTEY